MSSRKRNVCTLKHVFKSYDEASAFLSMLNKNGKDPDMETYPCDYGDHFHLGHPFIIHKMVVIDKTWGL